MLAVLLRSSISNLMGETAAGGLIGVDCTIGAALSGHAAHAGPTSAQSQATGFWCVHSTAGKMANPLARLCLARNEVPLITRMAGCTLVTVMTGNSKRGSAVARTAAWPAWMPAMSLAGHSKWHNIRHKKGAEDAKRSIIFAKVAYGHPHYHVPC